MLAWQAVLSVLSQDSFLFFSGPVTNHVSRPRVRFRLLSVGSLIDWLVGSVRFGSIKILATTYCCHVVGTGFLELQSLLEFLQRVHDFLDRLGALGRVLGKEILLLAGPDLGLGSGLRLRRRDDYLDGILVDAVLDHRRVGEDLPDRTQCRLVFLLPPVSVSGISDGELDRRTHGRNRR